MVSKSAKRRRIPRDSQVFYSSFVHGKFLMKAVGSKENKGKGKKHGISLDFEVLLAADSNKWPKTSIMSRARFDSCHIDSLWN